MGKTKEKTVTFKVDEELYQQLENIPNKSQFIRTALSSAIENFCPLCNGSGVMSHHQLKEWKKFIDDHSLVPCSSGFKEYHLVCNHRENTPH